MSAKISEAAKAALAPAGVLRAGINHSNFLLSTHDAGGRYHGVAIDLAEELARRLGVPAAFVGFESPGAMAEAVVHDAWDLAFMGNEPARAKDIAFSGAYLEIEAGYMVPPGSAIADIDGVDREGVRIALMGKSAYDLYLERNLRNAQIVRAASMEAAFGLFMKDKLEALAGIKPSLLGQLARFPGARILDGRFTAIQQSVGTPRARAAAGLKCLHAFVEEMKANGFAGRSISHHKVPGVTVAPAARIET